MRYTNDSSPWIHGNDRHFSMVDLVANETIPAYPAAMLWWALERGASLLTAGGPSGAGKSTFANACLQFLPDRARGYAVAGPRDPMLVPVSDDPTYLLISELSQHPLPTYIAGPAARRAFARLRDGIRIVGTLHADSVDQAIEALVEEVELSEEDIARVDLVVVTRVEGWTPVHGWRLPGGVGRDDGSVRRRIVEIGLLGSDGNRGVRKVELAAWSAESRRLEITAPPAGLAALARWAGVSTLLAQEETAERAEILASLAAEGRRDPEEVDDAVRLLRAA